MYKHGKMGEAVSTLVGHTQCISSVVWPQHDTIYLASWDHSVKKWDVETGKDLSDIALNCIDIGGEGLALIAAGGSDPVLRIWDPRKLGTSAPMFQFSSHSSWISACKWHNMSPLHLLSSSYDRKVMLWELRTAISFSLLCFDWWQMEQEKPTTLDCGPRTICRRHTMTGSYLYECLWEVLQQQIRMVLINMKLTPYVL
ncbi:hypothetical protein ES332_A07G110000v1 [Gossypium tomentosum]|uniref:Uncharacterized protein n=1 Tax=Gossypium tomentosum TaxID=34277 RepID=A0A5D2PRJ5_GOSTO|nr:hypothetical protein ES332_A07G110000v1 [Gossypium tomentosum]